MAHTRNKQHAMIAQVTKFVIKRSIETRILAMHNRKATLGASSSSADAGSNSSSGG